MRKAHRTFGRGTLRFLRPGNRKILAYLREHEDETILCVANLSRAPQAVELDLSQFKGRVPAELMGRTAFPPGRRPAVSAHLERPWLLCLSPGHGCGGASHGTRSARSVVAARSARADTRGDRMAYAVRPQGGQRGYEPADGAARAGRSLSGRSYRASSAPSHGSGTGMPPWKNSSLARCMSGLSSAAVGFGHCYR